MQNPDILFSELLPKLREQYPVSDEKAAITLVSEYAHYFSAAETFKLFDPQQAFDRNAINYLHAQVVETVAAQLKNIQQNEFIPDQPYPWMLGTKSLKAGYSAPVVTQEMMFHSNISEDILFNFFSNIISLPNKTKLFPEYLAAYLALNLPDDLSRQRKQWLDKNLSQVISLLALWLET